MLGSAGSCARRCAANLASAFSRRSRPWSGTLPSSSIKSGRALIIDEADYLVKKSFIELAAKDIYESSAAALILVGEEMMPQKLRRWEKVHGRMLEWVPAQPPSLGDARHLAKLYCPGIEVAEDLLVAIHGSAGTSVRRICVNLDYVREQAAQETLRKLARADFKRELFTGLPPTRRAA